MCGISGIESIVDHLNDVQNPAFCVTQRAVKDKFNLLKDKFITKKERAG